MSTTRIAQIFSLLFGLGLLGCFAFLFYMLFARPSNTEQALQVNNASVTVHESRPATQVLSAQNADITEPLVARGCYFDSLSHDQQRLYVVQKGVSAADQAACAAILIYQISTGQLENTLRAQQPD